MAVTVPASVVGDAGLTELVGRKTQDLVVVSKDLSQIGPLADVTGSAMNENAAE